MSARQKPFNIKKTVTDVSLSDGTVKKLSGLGSTSPKSPKRVKTEDLMSLSPPITTSVYIEDELGKYNYKLEDSAVVYSSDNKTFMKAIDKLGQRVYIDVDTGSYPSKRNIVSESPTKVFTDDVVVTDKYQCIGNDVCGVAFECGKNLCLLARYRGEVDPIRKDWTTEHAVFEDIGGEYSVTYPVIRLSDIIANPEAALINTKLVLNRLRNIDYVGETTKLVDLRSSLSQMEIAFREFDSINNSVLDKVDSDLKKLEEWREQYNRVPINDVIRDRLEKVLSSITYRHDINVKLLASIASAAELKEDIDRITSKFKALSSDLNDIYANLEYYQ